MRIYKCLGVLLNVLYLLTFSTGAWAQEHSVAAAGSWLSVLPPVLTIVFALTLKRVIPALFMGIWLGAWIINGFTADGLTVDDCTIQDGRTAVGIEVHRTTIGNSSASTGKAGPTGHTVRTRLTGCSKFAIGAG